MSPKDAKKNGNKKNNSVAANESAQQSTGGEHDAGMFESLGRRIDDVPKVRAAEEAMQRAHEQFTKARDKYEQARQSAADELSHLREKNLGDLVNSAGDYVSRHPGQGVLMATLFGFFLGRLFRR